VCPHARRVPFVLSLSKDAPRWGWPSLGRPGAGGRNAVSSNPWPDADVIAEPAYWDKLAAGGAFFFVHWGHDKETTTEAQSKPGQTG